MWNDGFGQEGMMGWSDWIFSFHGIILIVSLTVIAVVGTALFRSWRRDRMDESELAAPGRK